MKSTTNNTDVTRKEVIVNSIKIFAIIASVVSATIAIGISVWGFDTFMRIMG